MTELREKLSKAVIRVEHKSSTKTHKWISWESIKSITDEAGDVVGKLATSEYHAEGLKKFALLKARRLVALLFHIGHEKWLERFYHNDFGDDMFPIEVKYEGSHRTVESTKTKKRADFLEELFQYHDFDVICDMWQWMFFVPIFSQDDTAYVFDWRCQLPFVQELETSESNFSTVTHLVIHRGHLKFENDDQIGTVLDSDGNPHVAVKKLLTRGTAEKFQQVVENEASVLGRFQNHNHPHFVRAIARYTQENHHYFVFPWAKGGNLREFWDQQPSLSRASLNFSTHDWDTYIRWFFDQLVGLASAIKELHHPDEEFGVSCRHGDLKPENILCFSHDAPGPGKIPTSVKLVIADAGHAKVHEKVTELRQDITNTPAGTNTYKPPEVVYLPKEARSRRYDIWSLGCLYLEFIIWILYDRDGLQRFRTDIGPSEPFFKEHPEITVKDMVKKWIQYIKEDPRCSSTGPTALGRFVELIETRLLVVRIQRRQGSKPKHEAIDFPTEHPELSAEDSKVPLTMVTRPSFNINEAGANELERADAIEMVEVIQKIITKASGDSLPWISWDGMASARSSWPTANLDTRAQTGSLRESNRAGLQGV
ncbi:protein kinase domain-containing protein [Colletotrichum tofieldiae]|uniref:Protein kinase domain-containing protein n=1 Tax=Colletotrichum tofieldiae TaxID=708197 RepID=A0A166V553_9PEZI|nr:protein kinase domain-containing protein [Colletotrichum tofieldiae]GKT64291.1 protein kinase domain-containing protein [Colletotrichum tofieldiae]GKT74266.1 protein kinase domain-containing protein [Colletotrichum tofieldiae]GKT97003.1 protein kinase domain-containing protein [Colletotrichum tofieldiae]